MADTKEKKYVSDNAQLMAEWDWEKNNELGLYPDKLTCGSGKKVWWKCSKGHEWQAVLASRSSGYGCPFCAGQRVIPGKNDLSSRYPELALEWDYDKNGSSNPSSVSFGTRKKVWWKCSICGHSWEAAVANRTNGTSCPKCNLRKKTSFPEQAIFFYYRQIYPDIINGYKDIFTRTMELDIYIPSFKIAIEYDGMAWHQANKHYDRELKKYKICHENGITLIRIREDSTQVDTSTSDILLYISPLPTNDDFLRIFRQLSPMLSQPQDVDIERDRLSIVKGYLSILKDNSLLEKQPILAEEWDYDKNTNLLPSMVSEHSNLYVWWKCKKGHSWKASINSRSQGYGCPFCAGQRAIEGENDLATIFPSLLLEWDYVKNRGINPSSVMPGSNKQVWWRCAKGHSWKASINNRTSAKSSCPYCAGQRVIPGETDFATKFPELLHEWNYEKNTDIDPQNISPAKKIKVWWKCSKGHEWQATIGDRTRETGCPICSNRIVLVGYNDLESQRPDVAKEWDYEKNFPLKPNQCTYTSGKEVWWKCSNGHSWQADIYRRSTGVGCPYCSGRNVSSGETDLKTLYPLIAAEWDYTKNEGLLPSQIHYGSNKKVWWKCEKGHSWIAPVYKRTKNNSSCPICSNKILAKGINDLATKFPQIAKEWDYEKNAPLQPTEVTYGSSKIVWWKCSCGHSWKAQIYYRTNKQSQCPECAKTKHKKT